MQKRVTFYDQPSSIRIRKVKFNLLDEAVDDDEENENPAKDHVNDNHDRLPTPEQLKGVYIGATDEKHETLLRRRSNDKNKNNEIDLTQLDVALTQQINQ